MKNLKLKLLASVTVFFMLIVTVAVFTPFGRYALAYLNNYSQSSGDVLTADMWNNLDDDFGGTDLTVITDDCTIREDAMAAESTSVYCLADEVAVGGGTWRNSTGTYIGTLPTPTTKSGGAVNGWIGRVEGGGDRAFTAVKCCKKKTIKAVIVP